MGCEKEINRRKVGINRYFKGENTCVKVWVRKARRFSPELNEKQCYRNTVRKHGKQQSPRDRLGPDHATWQTAHANHNCLTVIALTSNVELGIIMSSVVKQFPLTQDVLNSFSLRNYSLKIGLIVSYLKKSRLNWCPLGRYQIFSYEFTWRMEPRQGSNSYVLSTCPIRPMAHTVSFNPHTHPRRWMLWSPFYRWGHWVTEKIMNPTTLEETRFKFWSPRFVKFLLQCNNS